METIRRRRDFLLAARARRAGALSLTLQARDRADGAPPRVGYTCSRKLGGAVRRNRAKRRLREAARLALAPEARRGWDYVLIGRPEATAARDFQALLCDLRGALGRVHA